MKLSNWPRRHGPLHHFVIGERGGILPLFAFLAVVLIGFLGVSIDAGRAYLLKARLSNALDSVALVGGQTLFEADRNDQMQKYFEANFPADMMGAVVEVNYPTGIVSGDNIEVTATAVLPTTFLKVLKIDNVTVKARAVVSRGINGMEVVLVLDNTGSMRPGAKMESMKQAAHDLVDVLFGTEQSIEGFYVGVVPYSHIVNIGAGHTDWLQNYVPADYAPIAWKGCVHARTADSHDRDDEPPSVALWDPFLWPTTINDFMAERGSGMIGDNDWDPDDPSTITEEDAIFGNEAMGPNLGCPPAITSLTDDRQTVEDALDAMAARSRGGTFANVGLAWGWRVISPQFQGLWGGDTPDTMPNDYDASLNQKVVVMMTDGVNGWYDWPGGLPGQPDDATYPDADYTAYGRLSDGLLGTTDKTAAKAEMNSRMSQLCLDMKTQGITIYTVLFQVNDSDTENLYRNCATSDEHFFDANGNGELVNYFNTIATEIADLRLAE